MGDSFLGDFIRWHFVLGDLVHQPFFYNVQNPKFEIGYAFSQIGFNLGENDDDIACVQL